MRFFLMLMLFAFTQTQAVDKARSLWGDTAYSRVTKLASSRSLYYEVGSDEHVRGGAFGSYDRAFIAALTPLKVPSVVLPNPIEIYSPAFVDIDTTINCPQPIETPFGTTPFSIDCKRKEAIGRYQKFVTDLCLHDVRYCEIAMRQGRLNIP